MSKDCKYCYYSDTCHCDEVCDYYFPIEPEAEDEVLNEMIESNRAAFYAEWFKYIEEDV